MYKRQIQVIASRFREDLVLLAGADIEARSAALPPVTPGWTRA